MPFYVSPEQQMLDRAEYARKGIARGRSVAVLTLDAGVLFVAENHSSTLHKVAELYDRIGFAAVGRYHEFELLRVAGIRHADLRGYSYARSDVTARNLAGAYSQQLGATFAAAGEKPFEVDLIVAELGLTPAQDVLYRISYDGVITDERDCSVIGGDAERITALVREEHRPEASVGEGLRLAARSLASAGPLGADRLEVGLLDRAASRRRTFRRIAGRELEALLDA
ncbi:proteasome subunit alpha [uncultured Tessaracoccus sp.]|uniref:proteasome subunit alpha n=1 Tax=uncultured Tessaracoccus sp. TaxID=905023 RepID=UPI0025F10100|nr:proteasome subunit alpha [uncultured Tessaracoccus sp.]